MADRSPPIHPGEILSEDFLKPLGKTPYWLARRVHVPVGRITAILAGKRAITVDTAIRIAKVFGTSVELWLDLQMDYELDLISDHRAEIEASIEPLKREDAVEADTPGQAA